MKRLEADTELRWANGQYLTSKIKDIPGIVPHKLYEGVTRAVYHLYPFRYLKEHFNNAPREKFMAALSAEGIPCSGGYGPQYNDGLIEATLTSKNFTASVSPRPGSTAIAKSCTIPTTTGSARRRCGSARTCC